VVVDACVVVVVDACVVVVDDPGIVVVVVVDPVVVVVDDPVVVVVDDVVVVVDDDVVVVVSSVAQIPFVMVLLSSVTAPFSANNCPCTDAWVFAVMDATANMCPTKWESVPKVAELPTCQKIRQYRAPLRRLMVLPDAVTSVEPVWNTKTPFGSPWASSMRVPVN